MVCEDAVGSNLTVTTTWKCNSSILFENGGQAYVARESYQVGKDFTLRSLGLSLDSNFIPLGASTPLAISSTGLIW